MDIYIDTANLDEIKQAADMGVLDGVTTNPSLVGKEGAVDLHQHLEAICRIVKGPVSAEVLATDYDGMVSEAQTLAGIAPNIVIKLPCIEAGIRACKTLSDRGVRTNLTLCFQPLQALMAAKAGAFLISPFVGRIDDVGGDGMELIQQIRQIYDNYAALIGSDAATCPFKVIQQVTKHPLTDIGLKRFLEDWAKAGVQLPNNQPAMA
jgi:transaldolase